MKERRLSQRKSIEENKDYDRNKIPTNIMKRKNERIEASSQQRI